MRDITTRGRWLFWSFLIAIFLLSVVPSVVLIEKFGEYYRFLTGWDQSALKQLKVSHVPHRDGPTALDLPDIQYAEFRLSGVKAQSVQVAGSFNRWQPLPMKREGPEEWRILLPLPRGSYCYGFEVDGEWRLDPTTAESARIAQRECSVRHIQ